MSIPIYVVIQHVWKKRRRKCLARYCGCGNHLVGYGNGYIITSSDEAYTYGECDKCGVEIRWKKFGKSMFYKKDIEQ